MDDEHRRPDFINQCIIMSVAGEKGRLLLDIFDWNVGYLTYWNTETPTAVIRSGSD